MQRLEDMHLVALLRHVASKAESRGTATNYSHLYAVLRSKVGQSDVAAFALEVGCETLQVADSHSRLVHLQMDTLALALLLLRTYTTADSRQSRCALKNLGSSEELSTFDVLDERRYIDVNRAAFYTSWLSAVETTMSLAYSHLLCQALVYFLGTCGCTIYWVKLRHCYTLYSLALCRLHCSSKLLTPFRIAIGEFFDGLGCRLYIHASLATVKFLLLCKATQMLFVMLHLFAFCIAESAHTLEHLVPIDKRTVKFRSVDTYELGLAANRESASTAHARAINHDSIERYLNRYVILLCHEAAELHHDRRTDCEHLVHMLLLSDELLDTYGHNTLFAIRTIVGHDDEFVRTLANFVFKNNKFFRTTCDNRKHTVASSLQRTDDRKHWSYANATTSTYYSSEVFYMGRVAERSYNVGDVVTLVKIAQLC